MSYCTLDDIIAVIPNTDVVQLTDGTGTTPDATKIAAAIASADAVIDGFLLSRYTLPLASTPPLLTNISVDLAIGNLYGLKHAADMPDSIQKRIDSAMKLLGMIQKGVISLGVEDVSQPATGGGIKTNKTADDRMFTKDKLSQW
jgi:phage gp36-like protein